MADGPINPDQLRGSGHLAPQPDGKLPDVNEQEYQCQISIPNESQFDIEHALWKALPSMKDWHSSDSIWDKVHVRAESPELMVDVYRYEEPGPFDLTIKLRTSPGAEAQQTYLALREKLLQALDAKLWEPAKPEPPGPQPPASTNAPERFPDAYDFECDHTMTEIKKLLDDAGLLSWQHFQREAQGSYLQANIEFRVASQSVANTQERLQLVGNQPCYRMYVLGSWQNQSDRIPTYGQIHETIRNTILVALGARNIRIWRRDRKIR